MNCVGSTPHIEGFLSFKLKLTLVYLLNKGTWGFRIYKDKSISNDGHLQNINEHEIYHEIKL